MEETYKIINEIMELRSKGLNDDDINKGIVKCVIREIKREEQDLIKDDINKLLFNFCNTDIFFNHPFFQKWIIENLLEYEWKEINQIVADHLFRFALMENWGYPDQQIPTKKAIMLSTKFFDYFTKEDIRYFSNEEHSFKLKGEAVDKHSSFGFTLTGGIEQCMICFDRKLIGCLFVLDHD